MSSWLVTVAVLLCTAILFTMAAATLWWMLHAWRTPETLSSTGFSGPIDAPRLSFSLLVPARHEQAVLARTLIRLAESQHPDVEVIAIIGHDDPETEIQARAAENAFPHRIRVVIDHSWPKNKPKALMTALPECRGEIIGVFDAEDDVDVRLLRFVDSAFRRTGADIVQSGVQLIDFRARWFSVRNCLEYFFWFRSRLHLQAEHGFIPLGGNTVFVRADRLRAAGGWNTECLAEDCELGVRMSSLGARTVVAYDPHVVTREETPPSVRALLKQRTRWNQGFLQVYRAGLWRALPRRRRILARFTLAQPFLQAFAGLAVPASIAMVLWARVPVAVALLSFLPAIPVLATVAFEIAGLRDFCRSYYVRPRLSDYLRLVLGTVPYQLILSAAAVRAVIRELVGQRGWEKTEHVGTFLGEDVDGNSQPGLVTT